MLSIHLPLHGINILFGQNIIGHLSDMDKWYA